RQRAVRCIEARLRAALLEFFEFLGHIGEALVHQAEDGLLFKRTVTIAMSGRHTRENLNSLLDFFHWPNVKLFGGHRIEHIIAQHEVFYVRSWNQNTLRTSQALDAADVEEAFDLFVDAADGLDVALLVHGA